MKAAARVLVIMLMVVCHFETTRFFVWSQVALYSVILLLVLLSVIEFWKNGRSIKIAIPEILLIGFIIYLFTINIVNGTFLGNHRLFNYLTILLLYFAFAGLQQKDKAIIKFIFYGLLAGLSLQLTVGFAQLFGLISNSDSKFVLGGLFGNPGAFAGYMAITLPFILAFVFIYKRAYKSENFFYLIVLCFFCAVCLVILCDSRGAWLASFIGMSIVLIQQYKLKKYLVSVLRTNTSKWLAGIGVSIAVVIISFALYYYKQQSAFGRILVWRISKSMVLQKPVIGNGFGFFEANYGKAQAHYFAEGNALESEIEVADYVTVAYNEFLEMVIESGIVGLSLFMALIYFAFARQVSKGHSYQVLAAKASLLSLLPLSVVSYPLRYAPNLLLLIICLFIIFRTEQKTSITIQRVGRPLAIGWAIVVCGLLYLGCRHVVGIHHFQKGYQKVLRHDFDDGLIDYKKARSFLKNNGEFSFCYGSALYLKQDYSASIDFLQEATALYSNPSSFIMLGNAEQQLKQYAQAEQAYQIAAGITPSRLYPKYLLAKLYIEAQQTEKALKMARLIVNTKEKIATTAGTEIKNEMAEFIRSKDQKR